jgi:hypothetical protein
MMLDSPSLQPLFHAARLLGYAMALSLPITAPNLEQDVADSPE